jgi:hypothetical protein
MSRLFCLLLTLAPAAVVGCSDTNNLVSDDGGAAGDGAAGGGDAADANPHLPGACDPAGPQCNNCVDDDIDGTIDGFDPECVSALDDDEGSFATGIPGDNIDAIKQDCFFDGNSGAGDDGCDLHVCCLLIGECPEHLKPEQYDPAECTPTQACIDNCAPVTPPGCDCFGCCTICSGDICHTVLTNPAVAPDCTQEVLADPALCPPCAPIADCGEDCVPFECVLCPGQTEADLPPECMGTAECPSGLTVCESNADCTAGQFCSGGCCINGVG